VQARSHSVDRIVESFDVFDTILSRAYATPEDVHEHLEELLRQSGLIRDSVRLSEARSQAEAQAWADRGGRRGAAIDEIYTILSAQMGWSPEQTHQAMEEEIRLERNACRPVPDMALLIEDARRMGRRICFISDMHLRNQHIRDMLLTTGALQDGDMLFVSSDCAALKTTGELFRHALKTLAVGPRDVRHTGDNEGADYSGARRGGISAILYTRAQLNRFERATVGCLRSATWRERSLATASKFTRLSRTVSEPDYALWDLLSSTIAPFVTGYALWLIEEAQKRGIEKLFFLARDMQIVHEAASYLAKKKGANVECIYAYASRNSWQPAGYSGPNEFELFWLTDQVGTIQPDKVIRRLIGANHAGEIGALLGSAGTKEQIWGRSEIRDLLRSDAIRPAVEQATRETRKILISYLSQCGYSPTRNCALVDAGWRGSLQKSLAKAYRLENSSYEILGFYIGLCDLQPVEPGCTLVPYLGDQVVSQHKFSLVSLIEGLLTANHGSTLGFKVDDGSLVEPVLNSGPSDVLLKQWTLVRDCCMAYAEHLVASPAWDSRSRLPTSSFAIPLLELCRDPRPSEATLLTQWFFDGGREESSLRRVANRIVMKDLGRLLIARMKSKSLADVYISSPWVRGAIAASSPIKRALANLLIKKEKSI